MRALTTALMLGCAGAGARDAVGESRDVTGAADADRYVYVARRPLGTVALAEARGLGDDDVRRVVDHLADALDACVRDQARRGSGASGAARVVVDVDDGGVIGAPRVTVSPGPGAQAGALLCVVAPLRMSSFLTRSGGEGATRGLALEATWGGT